MYLKRIECGFIGTNTYIVGIEESKEAVIIDPAEYSDEILDKIKADGYTIKYILLTHGHCDHTAGAVKFKEKTGCKVLIHQGDEEMINSSKINMSANYPIDNIEFKSDMNFVDGEELMLGDLPIKVIHTPGHTKGGSCFLIKNKLFCGDTLFAGSIGRTDFYGGSTPTLINSIKSKLMILPDNIKVYPGHGPSSDIKTERKLNPYLR